MTKKILILFTLLVTFNLSDIYSAPFTYDLHLTYRKGKDSRIMIMAHGMGGSYRIIDSVKLDKSLISFNFPDYEFGYRDISPDQTTFGTINEILPLLYVIKKAVIDEGNKQVDLYGFSAGGGAIINALGLLNTDQHNQELIKVGITANDKKTILQAIQKGLVILDTPLKSIKEIADYRDHDEGLLFLAGRYKENQMEPIDSMRNLQGLALNIVVHFQKPDEILSNRDDALFFSRLKQYNSKGKTQLTVGYDSGHPLPHPSLWEYIQRNSL